MKAGSLSRVPTRIKVCDSEHVPERGRLVLDVGDTTVGLFRLAGRLYAYENTCPHQGGPVCQGLMIGAVREHVDQSGTTTGREFDEDDLRIVCPWHGFEYSISTGSHPTHRRFALRSFPVEEEDGAIHVVL